MIGCSSLSTESTSKWREGDVSPWYSRKGLTFKEFAVKDPLPLSAIQEAVLEFLQGRDDAVVYGAHRGPGGERLRSRNGLQVFS